MEDRDTVLRQSKVAGDDRCKILISSLQDTLHGIENKSYGARHGGSRHSPERRHSSSRYRHHSPDRDRERYRERERSPREREYYRERERERSRSRGRDEEYRRAEER